MAAAFVMNSWTQTPSSLGGEDYEDEEEFEMYDTVKSSPRVVVDTSPPFASVEEAVVRFGGRGFWIPPHHFCPLHSPPPPPQLHDVKTPDTYKLEDRTTAMLNDLQMKEQETHEILKELELTKKLVEDLKTKLKKEAPEFIQSPYLPSKPEISTVADKDHTVKSEEQLINSFPTSTAAEVIMTELKQTKLHLHQNTSDLAAIRASVESLSRKIEREKEQTERPRELKSSSTGLVNPLLISKELRELNYEAEQFMRTAELARLEVLKAMTDVEQTKTGLRVIEMRWVAAKKLEEAARAAESLALAEIRALSSNESVYAEVYQARPGRISLSLEEYSSLVNKARKGGQSLFDRKDQTDPFMKIEEETEEKLSKMSIEEVINRVEVGMNRRKVSADEALRRPLGSTFQMRQRRNPNIMLEPHEFEFVKNENKPLLRPTTTSIGDILSRKLVVRDDELDVDGNREGSRCERQRVSLNQMLSQHRREISPLNRREKEGGGVNKNKLFSKRKGFGFVHISLPLSKSSKNKIQALNLW